MEFKRIRNKATSNELRCRKETGGNLRVEFWQPARFLYGIVLPPEEARMLLSGEAYKRGERFLLDMLDAAHRYSAPQLKD
jgi:hypothetical protein